MTDKYADLRAALDAYDGDPTDSTARDRFYGEVDSDIIRALLAERDRLQQFIHDEWWRAERGGRVSLAKRCRAVLVQEGS